MCSWTWDPGNLYKKDERPYEQGGLDKHLFKEKRKFKTSYKGITGPNVRTWYQGVLRTFRPSTSKVESIPSDGD